MIFRSAHIDDSRSSDVVEGEHSADSLRRKSYHKANTDVLLMRSELLYDDIKLTLI